MNADGSTSLELSDKDTKVRGLWKVADGSTSLGLFDKDGKVRGTWRVRPDGSTSLTLYDKDEEWRLSLGNMPLENTKTGAKEITPESSIVLADKEGKVIFKAP